MKYIFTLIFGMFLGIGGVFIFFSYENLETDNNATNHSKLVKNTDKKIISNIKGLQDYLTNDHVSFQKYLILKRAFCNENNPNTFKQFNVKVSSAKTTVLFNLFKRKSSILTFATSSDNVLNYFEATYQQNIQNYTKNSGMDNLKRHLYFCEFISNDSSYNKNEYLAFIRDENNYQNLEFDDINKSITNDTEKYGWYIYRKPVNERPEEAVAGALYKKD